MIELIFEKLCDVLELSKWVPYFENFAAQIRLYGSPYDDLVGLVDGKFTGICRPGGLGFVEKTKANSTAVRKLSMV